MDEFPCEDESYEKTEINLIVAAMPAMDTELYAYRYEQGFCIKQIGALLKLPEGTIKFLLYDMRKRLRRQFEP